MPLGCLRCFGRLVVRNAEAGKFVAAITELSAGRVVELDRQRRARIDEENPVG